MKRISHFSRAIGLGTSLCLSLLATPAATAKAAPYSMQPNSDVIGELDIYQAKYEDTFADIADRFNMGYNELVWANPKVDPWLPKAGTEIVLPSQFILPPGPRQGIVLNITEYRLYYYPPGGKVVHVYPIGAGREDWASPLLETRVASKVEKPSWTPPESIRQEHVRDGKGVLPKVVPPGPNNPLGPFAIRLGIQGYLIHGTNRTFGIGQPVSHGCIRMQNWDIADLFQRVSPGTPVRFIQAPVKVGVQGDRLLVEVHPEEEGDLLDPTGHLRQLFQLQFQKLAEQHGASAITLNESALTAALERATGVPEVVGTVAATEAEPHLF